MLISPGRFSLDLRGGNGVVISREFCPLDFWCGETLSERAGAGDQEAQTPRLLGDLLSKAWVTRTFESSTYFVAENAAFLGAVKRKALIRHTAL